MSIVNEVKIPRVRRTRIKGRSHTFDFNCRIGELIPFLCEELVAGDIVKYGVESVVQFPALKKPLFSDGWKVDFFYFFTPFRVLWKPWVDFLPVYSSYDEGGLNVTPTLPRIKKYNYLTDVSTYPVGSDLPNCSYSEWSADFFYSDDKLQSSDFTQMFTTFDYLGQNSVRWDSINQTYVSANPTGKSLPIDFGQRSYLAIYEYFFRDENLDKSVWNFETSSPICVNSYANIMPPMNAGILTRAWKKDYFTGGLPWIQKGVAPALPLYGTGSLVDSSLRSVEGSSYGDPILTHSSTVAEASIARGIVDYDQLTEQYSDIGSHKNLGVTPTVDLDNVTSVDVSELWTSIQIQKFLERNAHVGTRYNEFLLAHYGVAPRDETLQRPQFLGSTSQPVFVSEVVQNSESDNTPQGNKAGKAVSVGADYVGKFHCKEPGLLMGIMCISPKALYTQGVQKLWLKDSPYDFYNQLFENLSDQPTYNAEIFLADGDGTGDSDNRGIFNYMPRFAEYKIANDRVAGDLRNTLSMWHTGRIMESLPNFNSAFLHMGYSSLDRIFAVGGDTRNCICHVVNKLDMLRPMSYLNMVGSKI